MLILSSPLVAADNRGSGTAPELVPKIRWINPSADGNTS